MRYIFVLFATLITLTTLSQTNICAKIIARGFTKEFCEYDKKSSYKNIAFGTHIDVVASRYNLNKRQSNPNNFESQDEEARYWGNVKFDQCLFEFNSDKNLKGVQLQMTWNGTTEKREINVAAWLRIEEYLINLFGKPETFNESLLWRGENIYIILGGGYKRKDDKSATGALAIFTKNLSSIDGL